MTETFTEEQITFFRNFLKENSGYNLLDGKEYLLSSRLKIVQEVHGLSGFQQVINAIRMDKHGDVAIDTVEAMTVNETFFFRDDKPFAFFKDTVIPQIAEWSKTRPVKIWSAASSTGQEPYSIAIELEESRHKYPELNYQIDASDINNRILAKARHGAYTGMEVGRGLTPAYKEKYFTGSDDTWRVNENIRSKVTFFQQNLREDFKAYKGPYDVVFLRNVLIYFDKDLKEKVVKKVANMMKTEGYMILGVSENVYDTTTSLKREDDFTGIYRKTTNE